jgi:hypothetical protein
MLFFSKFLLQKNVTGSLVQSHFPNCYRALLLVAVLGPAAFLAHIHNGSINPCIAVKFQSQEFWLYEVL